MFFILTNNTQKRLKLCKEITHSTILLIQVLEAILSHDFSYFYTDRFNNTY